ncbi:peptide-methionine (R)-S-oxide reductase MsrB [Alteromonas sp. ASW11-130]|uniref:peptide-methionine (R)-S-oxide reductase MsrB n=1 Tax=Alteromonas sp. ASW11-130 TaxID=3015775 RepID=UPI00224223D3|nr:peptide-methionine (R)-S-oxide reductase MsrB [Alteromonas sp. ASW11-130]MCW8092078.1 peptide-methionine (R)-S-oxide reductase MsrB [Alteromonas sp. ASW11-130]
MSQIDWKDKLSQDEYRVCRMGGTERPFTGILLNENREGEYVCKCCGVTLFTSESKYDTGCGWPSFYDQSVDKNVGFREDHSHGMQRVEIFCKQCDAHLGHVFPDGPQPTGERYCVNSISLSFNPDGNEQVKG